LKFNKKTIAAFVGIAVLSVLVVIGVRMKIDEMYEEG